MIDDERISVQKDAIQKRLDEIRNKGLARLEEIQDEDSLQEWHRSLLGRKAAVMDIMREMSSMPNELRPIIGKYANEVKKSFEEALLARRETLKKAALERSLQKEQIDVTLPGRRPSRGRLHPETQALREISQIFVGNGIPDLPLTRC